MREAGRLADALAGTVPVARRTEDRLQRFQLAVLLDFACLELVHTGRGVHELLSAQSPRRFVAEYVARCATEELRPDIAYQCLVACQSSALNRLGLLAVFVRTQQRTLLQVSPELAPPRSFTEFSALVGTALLKGAVYGAKGGGALLRVAKSDLSFLPANCVKLGLEVGAPHCDLRALLRTHLPDGAPRAAGSALALVSPLHAKLAALQSLRAPALLFVVGAVAKENRGASALNGVSERDASIATEPLSAAECCQRLLAEAEAFFLEI